MCGNFLLTRKLLQESEHAGRNDAVKLSQDPYEYRQDRPMNRTERKIIGSLLGYFALLAGVLIYFFFFSGILY
jgi:hypothetical protein